MDFDLTTPEQRRAFKERGFVVFRQLISPEQVQELLVDYEKVLSGEIRLERWDKQPPPGRLVQLFFPSQAIPHWRAHPYFVRAQAISAELLGEDVQYFEDQVLMKPEYCDAETPWHQDSGYMVGEGVGYERAITCWLALSPSSRESGGLQFIPGSHLKGPTEHFDVESEIAGALETVVDGTDAVAPTLAPGDATFHHTRTLHFAAGNSTANERRGLVTLFWPTAN